MMPSAPFRVPSKNYAWPDFLYITPRHFFPSPAEAMSHTKYPLSQHGHPRYSTNRSPLALIRQILLHASFKKRAASRQRQLLHLRPTKKRDFPLQNIALNLSNQFRRNLQRIRVSGLVVWTFQEAEVLLMSLKRAFGTPAQRAPIIRLQLGR